MMHALMPLAEQAIVSGLLSKKAPLARKNKFGLALVALAGLFFCVAVIFSILAGYGWLLTQYSQPMAALMVSGSVLVLCLGCGAGGYLLLKKKPRPSMAEADIAQTMSLITDIVGDELAETIQENPKTAVAIASLAGFVAADYLH